MGSNSGFGIHCPWKAKRGQGASALVFDLVNPSHYVGGRMEAGFEFFVAI